MGPHLIFWEITENCNLECPYCRRQGKSAQGLSLGAALEVIDSIVKNYNPLLIFSGGEPLLYPNFFEVASYAHKKGLKIALATNSTLIDENLAKRIKSIGFHRVAISLDSARQEINDSLRQEGAFLKSIAAIRHLRFQGIELQINTTVLRRNFREIASIYNLCLELGIKAWHLFAFVPVGCGEDIPEEERLSQEDYEEFLSEVVDLFLESKIEIRMTCAPHYNRLLAQRLGNASSLVSKGCLAGSSVCFISSRGEVYPCGYLKLCAGNIFKEEFKKIWEGSDLFQTLRNPGYLKGKCSICEYANICGGCRARAHIATGDYLEEEPDCIYQPIRIATLAQD